MSKLALTLIVSTIALAACDSGKQTPGTPAASAGPPSYADIVANPAGHTGAQMEFKVSLIVGTLLLPTGETATTAEQSWEYPPGTTHSIAPVKTEKGTADTACIFVVTNDDRTPILPVQPIAIDNMSPCLAGSTPPVLTGKVQGVRDTNLIIDGRPTTIKAMVLSDPNFKAPF